MPDIPDDHVGWLFHDGDCALCRGSAQRLQGLLARRGIQLRTLQSPDAPLLLGLSGPALMREMRLLLADPEPDFPFITVAADA